MRTAECKLVALYVYCPKNGHGCEHDGNHYSKNVYIVKNIEPSDTQEEIRAALKSAYHEVVPDYFNDKAWAQKEYAELTQWTNGEHGKPKGVGQAERAAKDDEGAGNGEGWILHCREGLIQVVFAYLPVLCLPGRHAVSLNQFVDYHMVFSPSDETAAVCPYSQFHWDAILIGGM